MDNKLLIIISIFLIGFLYLGYQYTENQKYESWRECYVSYLSSTSPDQRFISVCSAMLTHRPDTIVEPAEWIK